jgi:hypothetical protein
MVSIILRFIFNVSVCITLSYLISMALGTGEINIRGAHHYLDTGPVAFYLWVGFAVIMLIVWLVMFLSGIFTAIDIKVKAFGGNYNKNTFKAIVRNALKKTTNKVRHKEP